MPQKLKTQGGNPCWTGLPSIIGPLTHISTQTLGQCTHTNSTHVHIFRMWEETRVPEKTHLDLKTMCKLPGCTSVIFLINVDIDKTLFEDLLCLYTLLAPFLWKILTNTVTLWNVALYCFLSYVALSNTPNRNMYFFN